MNKIWETLKDGWPIFAVIGAILLAVFNLWFNDAVDARVDARIEELPNAAQLAKLRADLKALENELHEGRTAAELEGMKEDVGRIEAGVNDLRGQFSQLLILLTQD